MELVHIYPQSSWHSDAYIVGNRLGIEEVHAALGRALQQGQDTARVFVNDGEGYAIGVRIVDDATAKQLAVPYTDDMAVEQDDTTLRPWELVPKS